MTNRMRRLEEIGAVVPLQDGRYYVKNFALLEKFGVPIKRMEIREGRMIVTVRTRH